MDIERLVRMVNDISRFYHSEPDHDEAVKGVAGHLERFWEPRMRRAIMAHVEAGGEGLSELGTEAVRHLQPVRQRAA